MDQNTGPRAGSTRSWGRRILRTPLLLAVVGLVAAAGLVVLAWVIHAGASPGSFRLEVARLSLQLALIVVLGALVKLVFDYYGERRAADAAESDKRAELLRRVRAQHVRIAYAQCLLMAHHSARTYIEQLRVLLVVRPELEDIAEDVRVARRLFGRDSEEIIRGIEEIVAYLDEAADEYVRCHAFVDADAKAGRPLEVTIRDHQMRWVDEFIKSGQEFPARYRQGLAMSKGTLRRHVYAQ